MGGVCGWSGCAVYVSPLFDLTKLTNFADDNFIIRMGRSIRELAETMKTSLEVIITWLKDSGLKVNESKTEMCFFHRSESRIVEVLIGDKLIKSVNEINECSWR